MIRLSYAIWLGAAAVAATVLFQVKDRVQDMEGQLLTVQRGIQSDREAIHVLKAEWSYLNRPGQIEDLARRHLGFEPLGQARISLVEYLPPRPEDFGRDAESEHLTIPPRRPATPAGWNAEPAPTQTVTAQAAAAKPASQKTAPTKTAPARKAAAKSAGPLNPVTGRPLPVAATLVSSGAQ